MPLNSQTRLIVILVGILIAIAAISLFLLWYLPGLISPKPISDNDLPGTTDTLQPITTTFNTNVLQTSDYLLLDTQLIKEGSLPVQPPAGVGKANPFL